MRRTFAIRIAVLAAAAWVGLGAHPAAAATLCVAKTGGCYRTIQAALRAAHAGDTIAIGRGTFRGGLHITASVRLVGRGPGRTVIRGGRSVITIGRFGATREPTVSIAGVTVTGGLTHTSPESIPFTGAANVFAAGGGIEIPPNADFSGGATVTITHSMISDNRVAPLVRLPLGPECDTGRCPFAGAFGAGIDSWGTLTLRHTTVARNTARGVASDADGGGIASHLGALVLQDSAVRDNRAIAPIPLGRFAEGGGIYVEGGSLRLSGAAVTGNAARMANDLPAFADDGSLIDMNANSGGVHVAAGPPVHVDHATISRNTVVAVAPKAEPCAFDSAMLVDDSPVVMHDTVIAHNRLVDVVLTLADVGPCGSVFDSDGGTGVLSHIRVAGNTSTVRSSHGAAAVAGAFSVLGSSRHAFRRVTLSDSTIAGNMAIARSGSGSASGFGGGVISNALLTLERVSVVGNRVQASAPTGTEQGGGIWSGVLLTGPPVQLDLLDSIVARNVLVRLPGIARAGGGLFTTAPHRISGTTFSGNDPDACSGCSVQATTADPPPHLVRPRAGRDRS